MKVRKSSMTKKIFIVMAAVIVVTNLVTAKVLSFKAKQIILTSVRENALNLAKVGANSIDPDVFEKIQVGDEESDEYAEVFDALTHVKEGTSALYVYSLRLDDEGKCVFAVDSDTEEPGLVGDEFDSDDDAYTALNGQSIANKNPTEDKWGTFLSAYAPIMKDGEVIGAVGVDMDYTDINKEIGNMKRIIIVAIAVSLIVSAIVLVVITVRLSKGFNYLNDSVKALADGSGDISRKLSIETGDEFEEISISFNAFIDQVASLVGTVAGSSNETMNTIGTMNNDILTLSANMEECNASCENVSTKLEDTVNKVSAFDAKMGDVGKKAEESTTEASESEAFANRQRAAATSTISEIKREMDEALAGAGSVNEINKIVKDINNVAMQTRLLSFNAQVEAAAAGEHGKGFAVVAEEVAILSDRISGSVNEIEEINEKVLSAVDNLTNQVEKMVSYLTDNVSEDYKAFAELGKKYGDTTKMICETMNNLKSETVAISEEISAASLCIADINHAIGDSAEKTEEISMSSGNILENMHSLMDTPLFHRGRF